MTRLNGLVVMACVCMAMALNGCVAATQREALERKTDDAIAMMSKALDKASTELSSQTAALAGAGALIDPGYRVDIDGMVGTGFKGTMIVRVVGGSAIITGNTQMGGPNRNVEGSGTGDSLLPPTE